MLERVHVNNLLNGSSVYQDTAGHSRPSTTLNLESTTYEEIVLPAIIGKLRKGVQLQIMREKKHHNWKMEDLFKELLTKYELKEEYCVATMHGIKTRGNGQG